MEGRAKIAFIKAQLIHKVCFILLPRFHW